MEYFRPRIKLRLKLALIMLLYTAAGVIFTAIIMYTHLQRNELADHEKWCELRWGQWQQIFASGTGDKHPRSPAAYPHFESLLEEEAVGLFNAGGKRVAVVKAGTFSEELDPAGLKDGRLRTANALEIVRPLPETPDLLLLVHMPFPKRLAGLTSLYGILFSIGGILLGLGVLLGLIIYRTVVRPVGIITDNSRRAASGDFEDLQSVSTGDEIEELSRGFQRMANQVRDLQGMALDASPLTGLPGQNSIAARINNAINAQEDAAVIAVDIDGFKAYNDVYGFEAGDRAISYAASILKHQAAEAGHKGFLGHVGGDDFIMIVPLDVTDPLTRGACRAFDADVKSLYNDEDISRGVMPLRDRQGTKQEVPFMSISMGGVDLSLKRFDHFSEVLTTATSVLQAAKNESGSAFIMDRRHGPPVQFERNGEEGIAQR